MICNRKCSPFITKKPYLILCLTILTFFLQTQKTFGKISKGTCPKIAYETVIKKPTDLYNYLGKWYEIIRSKSTPFQQGTCASAYYCLNKNGFLSVENQELRRRKIKKAYGEAKLTKDYNKFTLTFRGDEYKNYNNGEYRIINTDFKNYSVVYSCAQIDENRKLELIWVLARDPSKIKDSTLGGWVKYLDAKFGFKPDELIVTKHDTESCKIVDERDKKVKRQLIC